MSWVFRNNAQDAENKRFNSGQKDPRVFDEPLHFPIIRYMKPKWKGKGDILEHPMEVYQDDYLNRTRPATLLDVCDWLISYLKNGYIPFYDKDVNNDVFHDALYVLYDCYIPPLMGTAKKTFIVPIGVSVDCKNGLGHNTIFVIETGEIMNGSGNFYVTDEMRNELKRRNVFLDEIWRAKTGPEYDVQPTTDW